jgi:hypothetical protein
LEFPLLLLLFSFLDWVGRETLWKGRTIRSEDIYIYIHTHTPALPSNFQSQNYLIIPLHMFGACWNIIYCAYIGIIYLFYLELCFRSIFSLKIDIFNIFLMILIYLC